MVCINCFQLSEKENSGNVMVWIAGKNLIFSAILMSMRHLIANVWQWKYCNIESETRFVLPDFVFIFLLILFK